MTGRKPMIEPLPGTKVSWDITKPRINAEAVRLVSSLLGEMLKCPVCKKKWFDSWIEIDWKDGQKEKLCHDCFDKKYKKVKERCH